MCIVTFDLRRENRRHDNCTCTVEYISGSHKQNVHTKALSPFTEEDRRRIEELTAGKGTSPLTAYEAKDIEQRVRSVPADMTYREWYGKYVEGGELTGEANGGIIKSIDVDDYNLIVSGKKIAPEVNDVILTTMKQCEKDGEFVISEISDKVEQSESGGTPVLQIVPMPNGLLKLNVNVQYLSGKSLEEVNQAFVHTERNLAQSLEEAVIHESGHAISIKGKTAKEVDRFYQELKNQGKPGVSDIALSDGAELLAELEILRHRKTPVSKELSDFYEKYMGRKYL